MNKQDKLNELVKKYCGKWPLFSDAKCDDDVGGYRLNSVGELVNVVYRSEEFDKEEFQQRARELGYVNGYRWGVEYELDGKGPDLPDDTLIAWADGDNYFTETTCHSMNWKYVKLFKITDPRYKPADTSYLDAPVAAEPDSWYDYETQKALRLPPVGVECEVRHARLIDWYKALVLDSSTFAYYENEHWDVMHLSSKVQFRPLDWNRKAEAERKRVVDAVRVFWNSNKNDRLDDWFNAAYDAGYLRLPADKS